MMSKGHQETFSVTFLQSSDTYKIIKITQKNELIIRIICNRTNIKVEKIGGTMPEDLPTPEKAFSRLKKNNLPD